MSSTYSRVFRSNPHRDALDTWKAIVELLTQGHAGSNRNELLAVGGTAASVIAEQAAKDAAIVVTCDGPRTRVYTLHDDDAIDGSDAKEDTLGYDPLKGDWKVSLPCPADDLDWVNNSLKKQSSRITARDSAQSFGSETTKTASESVLVLDPKGFLGS
ncbi:hypothetical protein GCM10010924_51630 [Rhizobium wenxiniae]|uniref:Uncharacterized protein n=1 Tax=Rhizobium wenxiniae TaxID=1737357 RepID=A0A7W9YBV2_9HYPH|nr:hypothetical protein [Rhizobium wenxiniae]MBB6165735.1 hypothetical protein [Rhizobium wenxiniae]GGG16301.1 hypothetical protein GCM10010924_51630 [Rhizobium wenxiniae]